MVSGYVCQRCPARPIRCRSLSCPTVSGALVGHREIQAEQVHDRAQHALGLMPGSTEGHLSINPASIAMSEYLFGRPRRPVAPGIGSMAKCGRRWSRRCLRRIGWCLQKVALGTSMRIKLSSGSSPTALPLTLCQAPSPCVTPLCRSCLYHPPWIEDP
jgi:hypothetical protein